ncbi:unnamed protein product [Prunus armeniaca]|uniref:Uncharacterized protein n=1 Tax=Prunus armeniaca TaxID=36596 RepID=A0A6J5TF32_PRUAR|nr:unnamed protein product [Prunus armeniaca]CAB4293083.1 unnamed protein product [Prunus armeniaca]
MVKLLKGNLENVDLNSPMLRYLCAQSQSQSSSPPLAALAFGESERSQPSIVYRTPMRGVQREEVLVMDGVSVVEGGRSSRSTSDMSSSSSSSDSSGKILYKTDLYMSWEDSGSCRYTSKGQGETEQKREKDRDLDLDFLFLTDSYIYFTLRN